MWTVELFLDELRTVRRDLGLDRVHLFGSSWGDMLAMEYALTGPRGLASLVLASSPSSIPLWAEETARLRSELPEDVRATLDEHEEAGTLDDPAYEEATWRSTTPRLPERSMAGRSEPGPCELQPRGLQHVAGAQRVQDHGNAQGREVTDRLGGSECQHS